MPLDADPVVDESLKRILDLFKQSADNLRDEQFKILRLPEAERVKLTARSKRIKEMLQTVEGQMKALRHEAAAWVQSDLPIIYQIGAEAAAETLGGSGIGLGEFTWTQAHQGAVQDLAVDLFTDVLQMTDFVDKDTKRWVREVSKAGTSAGVIEGRTPAQIARQLVKDGAKVGGVTPITTITYKNGAKHQLDDYANMLIRTKTKRAQNMGTLNFANEHGVDVFEIFDGGECSLYSHTDGPLANGLIVNSRTARDHPLAHPNCRRSFGARPDLENEDVGDRKPSTTEAQRLDQTRADQGLEDTFERKATRKPRKPRKVEATVDEVAPEPVRKPRKPRKEPPKAKPGDRFRNTGTWTEGIADDFDLMAAADRKEWVPTKKRGKLQLANDKLVEAHAATKRIGNKVNAEVSQRIKTRTLAARGSKVKAPASVAQQTNLKSLKEKLGDASRAKHRGDLHMRMVNKANSGGIEYTVKPFDDLILDNLTKKPDFELIEALHKVNPSLPSSAHWEIKEWLIENSGDPFSVPASLADVTQDELADAIVILRNEKNAAAKALKAQDAAAAVPTPKPAVVSDVVLATTTDPALVRLEVLSELREFGGGGGINVTFGDKMTAGYIAHVQDLMPEIEQFMPTDWIRHVNRKGLFSYKTGAGGVTFDLIEDRAHASAGDMVVNVGKSRGGFQTRDVLTHEVTHLVDAQQNSTTALAFADLTERYDIATGRVKKTTMRQSGKLQKAYSKGTQVPESYSYVTEAGYPSDYSGRIYAASPTPTTNALEVNTMGVQAFFDTSPKPKFGQTVFESHFGVRNPVYLGQKDFDAEYLDFIAGLLAVG